VTPLWVRAGLLLLFAGGRAMAMEAVRSIPTYGATDGGPSVLLSNADGRNPYSGVVRYIGRAQCTGVFVATIPDGERGREAPAYVLTNGHCPEFPGANDVFVDRPAPSNHRVIFNYFADTPARQLSVPVSRIAYATLKGQDVAVPLTGAADTSFLRLAACPLESRANLVIEVVWHWFDYARRCADIAPGSSGSAVISRRTGRLLGLMNTTTIGAAPYSDCFVDHPCEPVPGDVASRLDTSYLTPLVRVDRCFDGSGRFEVARAGCPLDPGLQVVLTPATLGGQNPRREAGLLRPPRLRWDVTISGPFDHNRYKVADAATGDCRDLRGYGTPRRAAEFPMIEDPLPLAEGYQFLCDRGNGTAAERPVAEPRPPDRRGGSYRHRPPADPSSDHGEGKRSQLDRRVRDDRARDRGLRLQVRPSERDALRRSGGLQTRDDPLHRPAQGEPSVCLLCGPHDSALNPGRTFEVLLP
jgi:hypothetical protein